MTAQNPFQEAEISPGPVHQLAQVPKDKSVPWTLEYQGIEYPGEVIVTDRWRDEMGTPLRDDLYFRAIVLTQPQAASPQWLVDPRVVCWLPLETQEDSPVAATLRESATTYQTATEVKGTQGGPSLFTPQGYLISHGPNTISPDILSGASDDEGRLNRILSALMEATFGEPPIEKAALPKAITSKDAEGVFLGFFHPHPPQEALTALDSFAQALGLARPERPRLFDPSECKVFDILQERLAQWRGDWPVRRLYQELAQGHGLPWPLITLYLLSFVYHADPPVELLLRRGRPLTGSSGALPGEDKLRAVDIPRCPWQPGQEDTFDRLRYLPSPPWEAVLPYAILIAEELKLPTDPKEAEHQELLFLTRLQELRENLDETMERLQQLAAGLGEPIGDEIEKSLKRLSHLTPRKGYAQFYAVAQREYPAPDALAKDMALFGRLWQFRGIADEVVKAKSYLEKVAIKAPDSALALDRFSLLQQMSLGNLVSNPHLWPSVATFFRWFKSRYNSVYRAHHMSYQGGLANLRAALERSGPSLKALQYLNSLDKLGPPLGQELEGQYEALLTILSLCPIGEEGSLSEEWPTCPACGLLLTGELPEGAIAHFVAALENALHQQRRRLSSAAVRMILALNPEPKIEQFIKVIQASDLVSLANVLNDDLVSFLRDLLSDEVIYTPPQSIFKTLQEKLGPLSEEEIEAAGKELTDLLRETFAQAKRENPGKKIKINPA